MESLVNNLDLFMILRVELQSLSDSKKVCDYLMQKFNQDLNDENSAVFMKFCRKFCSNVYARWSKSNRMLNQFLKKNGDWLDSQIIWPKEIAKKLEIQEQVSSFDNQPEDMETIEQSENISPYSTSTPRSSTSVSRYLPRKPFGELSSKQKRRRVRQLSESLSTEELTSATARSLQSSGNEDVSKIMDYLINHPEDIERVKQCIDKKTTQENIYTPEKALALFISLKLSKWQYITLRKSAIQQGYDLYPSYYKLKLAKIDCYPSKEDIVVSEDGARIKLQGLLDLTLNRLLKALDVNKDSIKSYKLVSKWGFDGASSQRMYKQKTTEDFDESSVFMASLVPVSLLCNDEAVWQNDRPSSTLFCRPIMFKFMKETLLSVENVKKSIESEIEAICPTEVDKIVVEHQLLMTMIDGKITSYLSETSTATCDICKAKPSEMNHLDTIDEKIQNSEMYKYGLSSLHAWIRCMECLLHIAYRLEFKKWSARGEDKAKMEKRKKQIQTQFKSELGLLVDVVKQGTGTTNDGNTARRFFRDPVITSRITGINEQLIERFQTILQAIGTGEQINIEKFSHFCRYTAILYVELYPWYYMPSSIHKILIHGASIVEHFGLIPIGRLSEEASEARNKDFRNYRERHSRKFSRTATNEDILHNLLLSSDPQLSFIRPRLSKQVKKELSPKTIELLILNPKHNEFDFVDVDNLLESDDSE